MQVNVSPAKLQQLVYVLLAQPPSTNPSLLLLKVYQRCSVDLRSVLQLILSLTFDNGITSVTTSPTTRR